MKTKKIIKTTALILTLFILVLCIGNLMENSALMAIRPFEREFIWEAPSYVVKSGENTYVVDASKTRITRMTADGSVDLMINGKGGSMSFSNTDYIAADGQFIYIADVVYASSGTRVSEEHIKKFDMDGNYVSTLFSVQYEEGKETMPAQNGYICWMGYYDGTVYFIYYDHETLTINRLIADSYVPVRVLGTRLPEIWNITYDAENDLLYYVGKDSLVWGEKENHSGFTQVKSIRYDERSIFSDIDAAGGSIYATDIGMCQIVNVIDGSAAIGSEDPAENALFYRVSAHETGVAATDNMAIYLQDGSDVACFESTVYADALYRSVMLVWLSLALTVLAGACILGAILVTTVRSTNSKYTTTSLIVAAAVLIATAAISTMILTETFTRLTESAQAALLRTADVISSSSGSNGIGDAVEAIDSIDDYGNEQHMYIQKYMDSYCDAAYNSGSNMYYVVYKFNDNLVYGIADYEKTAGAIYPYCPYEDSDYQIVAETGEIVSVAASMDAYGAWAFAIAPLYNSDGEITAVAEFGINMQTEQAQNYELIKSIIIRVAVIILLIILFLIEGTALMDGIAGFRTERDSSIPYFLRPMMFLTFFASNLAAAFIPQLSFSLFNASGLAFSGTLASALPMSLQLFATALAALFAGHLLERFSMKLLMLIACGIQAAGYITIAMAASASDYITFSIGHFLSGLGIGVVVVALNTLPDRVADEDRRNGFYAGLNAGVISGVVVGSSVGSYIAELTSHSATFLFSTAVVVLIALLILISVPGSKHSVNAAEEDERRIGTVRFLLDKDVWSFLICVMVPMLMLLYFKDYLFPMFGSENGMNDTGIGNILLFAGAASIVFGPTISDVLFRHLRTTGTVILSSALTCATLIMFGMNPTVESAVAAVIILSLATGFGLAGQEVFYSSLPAFRSYGTQRSMSIYSLCDNASQTAGPLLMGAMLSLGYAAECRLLGFGGMTLLAVFIVIRLLSKIFTKEMKTK